jgi:hypothetical protein
MSKEQVLETRVHGVNRAHQYANELYPKLVAVFQSFIGQKITKVDGSLLAKVQKEVNGLGLPCEHNLHVYRRPSNYALCYMVKTCETTENSCHYHEASVTVGNLDNGFLVSLCDPPQYKTDFSAFWIADARKRYEEAKKLADQARGELYPFGEYD